MRRVLCIVGGMVLAGCAGQSVARAVPVSSAAVPVDVLGTWVDPAQGGFVIIGQRQVVVSLAGGQRAVLPIVENRIEPGFTGGQLVLADGVTLFVARSASQGLPAVDLEFTGGLQGRHLLIAEAALRWAGVGGGGPGPGVAGASSLGATPARATSLRPTVPVEPVEVAAARVAAAGAVPTATASGDRAMMFIMQVPASRRESAERLVEHARRGASTAELGRLYGDEQRAHYRRVLEVLEQACREPARRAELLAAAGRLQREAAEFAAIWQWWQGQRDG